MKTQEILDRETINYKEVCLLMRRMNADKEVINIDSIWDSPKTLEDHEKGLKYLLNQWKTPKGKERLNSPFGYREQAILENFDSFELAGTYDIGNMNFKHHVPLWNVCGNDNKFQYHMSGGTVNIVG